MKNKTCKWNLNVNVQNKSMFNAPKTMPSFLGLTIKGFRALETDGLTRNTPNIPSY